MAAGSIIIDLLMRTGSFETDTARAGKRLREFEKQAERTGKILGAALAAGAIVAVAAFDQLVKGAANFKDLEETTGASAEGMASLAVATATAGLTIDAVADASIKLTKSLTGVDDESKAAGAALAFLNLPIEEFKALDPVARIDALTKAFGELSDGTLKTELAVALFGKTGAEQLKLFKALEQQGGRQTILTQQQIELADAYADAQAEATAQIKMYAQAAATQMLPALNDLSVAARDFIGDLVGIDKATGKLAGDQALQRFADGAADAFAFVVDAGHGVVKIFQLVGNSIAGAAAAAAALGDAGARRLRGEKVIGDGGASAVLADSDAENERILGAESFRDRLDRQRTKRTQNDALRRQEDRGFTPQKPALKFDGAVKPPKKTAADKDDPTKKLLDNELRGFEAAAERERDVFTSRNKFLELYNSQGLLSISSYYDAQRVVVEAATAAQASEIDKQIVALQRFQSSTAKQTDKTDAQGKINALVEKRGALFQEAGEKGIEFSIRQTEEEHKLGEQVQAVSASVLELQGHLGAAAAIRFDQQHSDLTRRLTAEGNVEGLQQLGTLRKSTVAQGEFAKATIDADRVMGRLRSTEDSIAIARQLGATTEMGALQQLGEARQASVVQLESIVAAQEAGALASGNPAQVENAQRLRLELEKLKATADPLADSFRSLFEEGFGDAFGDFIDGTKSASEAFKSFANDVLRQINRMVAQDIAQSLFGKGGVLGGAGGLFADIFGGKKSPLGEVAGVPTGDIFGGKNAGESVRPSLDTSAVSASLASLQAAGIDPTTLSLQGLAAATDAAAAAVQPSISPSLVSLDGSVLGATGDFARADRSGEQSIADMFKGASEADSRAQAASDGFSKSTIATTVEIARLAASTGKAGGALSALPSILQSILGTQGGQAAASSAGGFIGSLFGGSKPTTTGDFARMDRGQSSGGFLSSIGSFISSLFLHSGGVVGQTTDMRPVDPGVFGAAKKYHAGRIVDGKSPAALKANEVPAILLGGPVGVREEVLAANDPRHRDNIAASLLQRIEKSSVASVVREAEQSRMPRYHDGGVVGGYTPRTAGLALPVQQAVRQQRNSTVQQTFAISGPIDKRTQDQIGAAAYRGVLRANMRDN